MASWKDDYLAALQVRDEAEKAHLDFYEAYTRVADRSAECETTVVSATPSAGATSIPPPVTSRRGTSTNAGLDLDAQLREDLSKAQHERAELQSRLDRVTKELEKFKSRSKADSKRVTQLTSELSHLSLRVRDRDEESRGKVKLLDDVQDEVVTLNLQLNMAEEERKKLRNENQELVDRWMKHKAKEADKMNTDSKF